MYKILIIEDDGALCEELKELLTNAGYKGEYLTTFDNVAETVVSGGWDLILMDINLPGINGEMLLREVRKKTHIPVIMVTSRTGETDELLSMSFGADDYITKPYNPNILLLRIGAILKRIKGGAFISYKGATLDVAKSTLGKDGREIILTKNEMLIFQHLLSNQNRIVSRDELMTVLWDNSEFVNDNALTVNISRLRTKLADFGFEKSIETRKKQGYILL